MDGSRDADHGRPRSRSRLRYGAPTISEKELVDLNYAVIAINAWNRLAIAFRKQPRVLAKTEAA
jgi:hypothetical protein